MATADLQTKPSTKALLLAGGKSSRLGRPKHLLRTPQQTHLYQHQLQLIQSVLPDTQISISLAQESQRDELLSSLQVVDNSSASSDPNNHDEPVVILLDQSPNETEESSGPASGLIAAHACDPNASWLVVACDYPLIPGEALEKLLDEPRAVVKCFKSAQGFCEPLLGLWSSEALSILAQRVAEGRLSPSAVVKELGGEMLEVPEGCGWWLSNVNTPEEWTQVLQRWEQSL